MKWREFLRGFVETLIENMATNMGLVIWITGNTTAGKTTLAEQMRGGNNDIVIIDGDVERDNAGGVVGFSKKARWEHNLKIAIKARRYAMDGHHVIVAVICPYKKLREEVQAITNCSFIYLSSEKGGTKYPYQYEKDKFYFKKDV